jgi:hypothetical protein
MAQDDNETTTCTRLSKNTVLTVEKNAWPDYTTIPQIHQTDALIHVLWFQKRDQMTQEVFSANQVYETTFMYWLAQHMLPEEDLTPHDLTRIELDSKRCLFVLKGAFERDLSLNQMLLHELDVAVFGPAVLIEFRQADQSFRLLSSNC